MPAPNVKKLNCRNCVFSDLKGNDLICRFNPPIAHIVQKGDKLRAVTAWPIVTERDYCAHHGVPKQDS